MPRVAYPVCKSITFPVVFSPKKNPKKTTMVLRSCVEQVGVHSYRASLTLHEVDLTTDDRVGASYTVELRRCGTGELVKTRSGDGGGLTQIIASTAVSSGVRVYAVSRVGTTTLKVKGGKVFSGPGKTVTATSTCG